MTPYYQDELVTLYHGDCRDVLPTLSGPFDAVISDPPYPGYEKGWGVPDVSAVLGGISARVMAICWPVLVADPLPDRVAEHIWHKPNGNSAHQYERVLVYGDAPRMCKVFRIAAILPNYQQYKREAEDHPTQKPEALMLKLISLLSKTGVILDPFAGSGTTLAAAKRLGRMAIGIETDRGFCDITARRLSQGSLSEMFQ